MTQNWIFQCTREGGKWNKQNLNWNAFLISALRMQNWSARGNVGNWSRNQFYSKVLPGSSPYIDSVNKPILKVDESLSNTFCCFKEMQQRLTMVNQMLQIFWVIVKKIILICLFLWLYFLCFSAILRGNILKTVVCIFLKMLLIVVVIMWSLFSHSLWENNDHRFRKCKKKKKSVVFSRWIH